MIKMNQISNCDDFLLAFFELAASGSDVFRQLQSSVEPEANRRLVGVS